MPADFHRGLELFGQQSARLTEPGYREFLGQVLSSQAKDAEAEPHIRRSFDLFVKRFGADSQPALIAENNLAFALKALERWPESEHYFRDCIERRKRVLGPDHVDTLISIENLASLFDDRTDGKRDPSEAERLYRECLTTRRSRYGPEDSGTLLTTLNFTAFLREQNHSDEAEQLILTNIEAMRRTWGTQSVHAVAATNALCFIYREKGNHKELLKFQQQNVTDTVNAYGADDPRVMLIRINYATCLFEADRLEDAERELTVVEKFFSKPAYLNEINRGWALTTLGTVYMKKEQYPPAEVKLREALRIREISESVAWKTARTKCKLGQCLMEMRRYADAEKLLLSGYESLKNDTTAPPQFSRDAAGFLVQLYDRQKKPSEAEPYRKYLEKMK